MNNYNGQINTYFTIINVSNYENTKNIEQFELHK